MLPKLSPSLPWYCCVSHQTFQLLLYLSPEIPVTLKACRNTLLGSDTLLKLLRVPKSKRRKKQEKDNQTTVIKWLLFRKKIYKEAGCMLKVEKNKEL
jgi:hypothetical protein